jgi:dihydrofolate synthase/folylpolyglutamate synthase
LDFPGALAYLEDHTNFEGKKLGTTAPMPTAGHTAGLGLEAITELLHALGDPHLAYRVIHVTGTNGKGSTTRFASAILSATGLSVGTFTSPNIERINERLTYNDLPISDADFARIITLLADVEPLLERRPTRWDLLTAAAFVWFADLGVDVAVVEVGLLGRYDSTNVVEPDVALITNIGKDHTDGTDGWRFRVASEKAGIIKPDCHVVLGDPMEDVREIIDLEPRRDLWVAGTDFEVEANLSAVGGRVIDLRTPGGRYEQLHVPFHGRHQGTNLASALAVVEAFFDGPVDQELVEEALLGVELPARFEVVSHDPVVVLDGAHNPDGARAAKETLDSEFARLGSWVLVIGILSGKDPAEMLIAFGANDFDAVIVTQPDWSRAIPAEEIAAAASQLGIGVEVVPNAIDALTRAQAVTAADDLILVSGSIYVVGEVRAAARSIASD